MNFVNPDNNIIKEKKLYIFDMDGTIYLGGKPFDFAGAGNVSYDLYYHAESVDGRIGNGLTTTQ